MHSIKDIDYKNHEICIYGDGYGFFTVDIRIDDTDGHMMQGFAGLASLSEAESVGKAFIDGLHHVEETGIQFKN